MVGDNLLFDDNDALLALGNVGALEAADGLTVQNHAVLATLGSLGNPDSVITLDRMNISRNPALTTLQVHEGEFCT